MNVAHWVTRASLTSRQLSQLHCLSEKLALATGQNSKMTGLEKGQARLQALAILTDPIEVVRVVAQKTGHAPITARTSRSDQCADLSVWHDIRQVADAVTNKFIRGNTCIPSCSGAC